MKAGEAAKAAGVTRKALRYYESAGLLVPRRLANGYREYSPDDVRLAVEIRALMAIGLSPKETEPFLDCLRGGHTRGDECPESLAVYDRKIRATDRLIARLSHTRGQLVDQLRAAAGEPFAHHDNTQEDTMLPPADPLPDNLPAPADDGAAGHLPGRTLPPLTFLATDGSQVRLDAVAAGRWILFVYPLTGDPAADIPQGWNEIPGARGCSQEACSFRDSLNDLRERGVDQVVALSSDRAEYQQALVRRLHLPYPLLSDPDHYLSRILDLPTFEANGSTLYKRITLVLRGATIEHVFYPIFPPDTHAQQVVQWLREHP
nr:MerR family transcriptional regulator [Kibdelosporangium sp. MJ126-NF4]CEL20008.1 Alkyl hydroperoxide reductase subunit C-like protein [Kibdelosporangium sp. MJ126-NF4]CTQ97232.1 Alkyl hydroperoxide reductase subunit C-like protein [Kibdelosporangium sp. MJ126-NF4]